LLGAAGAVEAVLTVLSVRDRVAPMTRNLDHPDSRIELDVVTQQNRTLRSGLGLSNSFGFGGHNVVLAFAPIS
jgi:3-oxoacyl-[acyl-carrier-protein] synthase II